MDEPSRDLLASLSASIEGRPWLVLLSRRPGTDGFVAPEEGDTVRRIALGALGTEQAAALIDAATADAPLMPRQVRTLAERAQGNPLFLIELLDALRRGRGRRDAAEHRVEGLIHARIDRLAARRPPPPAGAVGARHRVSGPRIVTAGAERVGRPPSGRPAGPRARLRDFLSVDRTRAGRGFRHALIRDAAYQGLAVPAPPGAARSRIGDSILAAAGDDPEDAGRAASSLHYSHARRWPEAWRFSRTAGDRAREVYANRGGGPLLRADPGRRGEARRARRHFAGGGRRCAARHSAMAREATPACSSMPPLVALLRTARPARRSATRSPAPTTHVRRARVLVRMGSSQVGVSAPTPTGYTPGRTAAHRARPARPAHVRGSSGPSGSNGHAFDWVRGAAREAAPAGPPSAAHQAEAGRRPGRVLARSPTTSSTARYAPPRDGP